MKVYGTVVAGESTLWGSHVYQLFVTDDGLHFGRVADRLYKELEQNTSPFKHVLGGGGALVGMTMQPAIRSRLDMENTLDAIEPGSADFLALHKKNFSLRPAEILKARLSPVRLQAPNGPRFIGMLELHTTNAKKRKFSLVGLQEKKDVEALLRQVLPSAEGSLS